uniref:6-O-methylguanine DNA methyltransferase, DNA binding domain n=1 Tax=Pithovirus LCPAC001 TaxID=2506585 RepID=A0A481Z276_9VIRU|nr:MAG: 6-O-methylguanine DNA methyltransferase, DNA binding domain [Pithovirus LCPAC001]
MDTKTRTLTKFQLKVLEELTHIPKGMVTTYKILAIRIGVPGSARAIGSALKLNPDTSVYPCHRVIKTNLSIGGYFGRIKGDNIDKKMNLLKTEGVIFNSNGKLVDSSLIWS